MISESDILRAKVLIVDDQKANVLLLEQILRGAGYVAVASTMAPAEVCALHVKHRFDLILLDLQMPCMDGFQVMEALKETEPEGYPPVLVITAQPGHKLRAFKSGARDFIGKPIEVAEVLARVHNMLETRLLDKELRKFNEVLELRVQERTADLLESHLETIYTMMRAAEYKDEDTGTHVQRISYYSRDLARMLGMDDEFVDRIFIASPMHDIGKIGIPDRILLKPGRLSPDEWEVMKGHTTMGGRILGNSKSPYLRMGAEIALNHHERWDGGGYPQGKRGDEIPLTARIMNIGDVYDALRSKRPYKPAFEHRASVEIISNGDGQVPPRQFDPAILEMFMQRHETFRDIYETYTA